MTADDTQSAAAKVREEAWDDWQMNVVLSADPDWDIAHEAFCAGWEAHAPASEPPPACEDLGCVPGGPHFCAGVPQAAADAAAAAVPFVNRDALLRALEAAAPLIAARAAAAERERELVLVWRDEGGEEIARCPR